MKVSLAKRQQTYLEQDKIYGHIEMNAKASIYIRRRDNYAYSGVDTSSSGKARKLN